MTDMAMEILKSFVKANRPGPTKDWFAACLAYRQERRSGTFFGPYGPVSVTEPQPVLDNVAVTNLGPSVCRWSVRPETNLIVPIRFVRNPDGVLLVPVEAAGETIREDVSSWQTEFEQEWIHP